MRGKHASSSRARREQSALEATIANYERTVKMQRSEIASLTAEVDRWRTAHANDTRSLRTQVAAGTSREVDNLTDLLKEAKRQLEEVERERRVEQKRKEAQTTRLIEWFKADKKVSGTEALEWLARLNGHGETVVVSDMKRRGIGVEAATRIETARGHRRSTNSGGAL